MKMSIVSVVALLVLVLSGNPVSAEETEEQPTLVIGEWLALGPVPLPLPAFGDQEGKAAAGELISGTALPVRIGLPSAGRFENWFGTEAVWSVSRAGADGVVSFEALSDSDGDRTSAVWLTTMLEVERFLQLTLEVESDHPSRIVVDGSEVASGDEIDLPPGSHLLVIQSVADPGVDAPWSVGAKLAGEHSGSVEASIDSKRNLGILDVTDLATATGFDLSPDGREIVLSMTRVVPGTDLQESWVEIRSTVDGSLAHTIRGATNPSQIEFAPTGRRISYVSRDGTSEAARLVVADLETGSAVVVLENIEDFGSYLWSPVGDAVVYSVTEEYEKDESGITRLRGLLDRMVGNRDVSSLYLATVPDGITRRLTAGRLSASASAFSPDGRRLLVTREVEDLSKRPYTRTEIWELDLAEGGARKIRDGRWIQDIAYAPDGRRLLVRAGPSEFGPEGLDDALAEPVNDYDGQLFIWSPETDEVDAVTRSFDPAISSAFWSPFDGAIYALTADGHRNNLYRYTPDDRSFAAIATGIESISEFSVAEQGPTVVAGGSSVWQPQQIVALDHQSDDPRLILEPAAERFSVVRRGEVVPWDFTASDDRLVAGRIYLPVGFEEGGRYPAIVNYYGGTAPMNRSFGGRYPAEWWAANGYVVYVLTPTGSYGWGQTESTVHVNDWGEVTSGQIIEATEAFLDEHPFVDPERVGCIGASYGGFMTMYLVTKTDLFEAAVAHAGISALSSYWGEGYWGYSYGAVANAGSFPWNRRDIFVDRSPLFHADRVTTSVLLTHGEEDPNVPPGESDQFYAALKILGVETEYLRIAGLGHHIMEHDKRVLWSQSILAWFDSRLKGQLEWWEALYPEP